MIDGENSNGSPRASRRGRRCRDRRVQPPAARRADEARRSRGSDRLRARARGRPCGGSTSASGARPSERARESVRAQRAQPPSATCRRHADARANRHRHRARARPHRHGWPSTEVVRRRSCVAVRSLVVERADPNCPPPPPLDPSSLHPFHLAIRRDDNTQSPEVIAAEAFGLFAAETNCTLTRTASTWRNVVIRLREVVPCARLVRVTALLCSLLKHAPAPSRAIGRTCAALGPPRGGLAHPRGAAARVVAQLVSRGSLRASDSGRLPGVASRALALSRLLATSSHPIGPRSGRTPRVLVARSSSPLYALARCRARTCGEPRGMLRARLPHSSLRRRRPRCTPKRRLRRNPLLS